MLAWSWFYCCFTMLKIRSKPHQFRASILLKNNICVKHQLNTNTNLNKKFNHEINKTDREEFRRILIPQMEKS